MRVMRLTLAHRNRFLTIISLVRPRSADEFDAPRRSSDAGC